ncbi:MAG: hypothetical protein JNK72_17335 [Myxococcales bacterium]|nr:hypothetical protein [Myxococcales bacterium]
MAPETIVYADEGLKVRFDATGLTLDPWWAPTLHLAWSCFKMVSITPAVTRVEGVWRQTLDLATMRRPGPPWPRALTGELCFVLYDRRPLLAASQNWRQRLFLRTRLRGMMGVDETVLPDESALKIELRTPCLDTEVEALFDLLERHVTLGLVVYS